MLNNSRNICLVIISFIFLSFGIIETDIVCPYNKDKAQQIEINGFNNLYKVSDELYRSEQPGKNGMKELQKLGIHTIINLRNIRDDKNEAKGTNLILEHIPIKARDISYFDVLKSLEIIRHAKKPVLVHCLHGSDRTGCVVAAYRMVFENWPKEKAIDEFRDKNFGYHERLYPNILTLLKSLDIEMLKNDLGIM